MQSVAGYESQATEAATAAKRIDGWFTFAESLELYEMARKGLLISPSILEIGSYKGKSTSVLGRACKDSGYGKVYAVDPHAGHLWQNAPDLPPTLAAFQANIRAAELEQYVVALVMKSAEVHGIDPVGAVFIDGLHDYENVRADFQVATRFLAPGGYISFHDMNENGPFRVVNEALETGLYERVSRVDELGVLRLIKRVP